MADPDYEYLGMIVDYWNLLTGDNSRWPDRILYRDLVLPCAIPPAERETIEIIDEEMVSTHAPGAGAKQPGRLVDSRGI